MKITLYPFTSDVVKRVVAAVLEFNKGKNFLYQMTGSALPVENLILTVYIG